ncbi:MAG: hypothetical protein HKM95_03205 [Inquilinus sp.]|nr:hypothetical protein [Inquilinus sp.]
MGTSTARVAPSPDTAGDGMIRLTDMRGREHIFAPYRLDAPLPSAPGILALVRPRPYRIAGLRGIVDPPWWDVLYVEQARNVSGRAAHYAATFQAQNLGQTQVMLRWMPNSTDAERHEAEQMLIEAHDPALNRPPEGGRKSAIDPFDSPAAAGQHAAMALLEPDR